MKNLPGQRQGSKEWYWYLRKFLEEELQFTFCSEQPCLARVAEAAVLMHVDDLLFCGSHHYFHEVFLPKCQQKFTVNFAELGETGSNISFLKKKIIRMDDGILVTPGIPVARISEAFEESFAPVRGQVIPCHNSIQLEDVSQLLSYEDASSFGSVVGMALYLGRDRPDAIFTIKEVASRMSKPTVTALQHLRKRVGNCLGIFFFSLGNFFGFPVLTIFHAICSILELETVISTVCATVLSSNLSFSIVFSTVFATVCSMFCPFSMLFAAFLSWNLHFHRMCNILQLHSSQYLQDFGAEG